MALLPEWGMRTQGIVCGVVGIILTLITVGIWRKMEGKGTNQNQRKNNRRYITGRAWCAAAWRRHVPVHGIFKNGSRHRDWRNRHCGAAYAYPIVKRTKIKKIIYFSSFS